MPIFEQKVFEQYEFRGWLITIESDYRSSNDELTGFAVPTKYAHLLNRDNVYDIDEIAKENGIETIIDEYGDEDYEDFGYVSIDAIDDETLVWVAGVNMQSPSSILNYLVKQILSITIPPTVAEINLQRLTGRCRFHDTKLVILKQVNKKSITPKTSKRARGFKQVAWSTMVKERDGKCTECGSVYDLHAHHIKSFKEYPDLRYDVTNGITLCADCHRKWHKEHGK